MKIYIVTSAHQCDGTIYQEAILCDNQEHANNVFDSFVEDFYESVTGNYPDEDDTDFEQFKVNNTKRGWEFDYETGDCTEQYHAEIFETEMTTKQTN